MFGSRVAFSAELRFPKGFHTRPDVARNPCVNWAFLYRLVIIMHSRITLAAGHIRTLTNPSNDNGIALQQQIMRE